MSLSSFLLDPSVKSKGKSKHIDKDLDDLFRLNTAVASVTSAPVPESKHAKPASVKEKKRKLPEEATPSPKPKKLKASSAKSTDEKLEKPSKKSKKKDVVPEPVVQVSKHKHKKKHADPSDTEDETNAPEASSSTVPPQHAKADAELENPESDPDSDEEGDLSKLVHESVAPGNKSKHGGGKTKFVPEEETPEQRNARTVFVGNVPVDVVKNRPLQKQFNRHILSFVPSAKIESVRFRSVAFKKPTIMLPPIDGSEPVAKATKEKDKDGRQHDKDRAASWRANKPTEAAQESEADRGKSFLSPAEKKRIAFINQEFHEGADSVNAYVVFAHPVPVVARAANVPPPKPVMDPFEAARTVVRDADGSTFMGRSIRVDTALKPGAKVDVKGKDEEISGDPRTTVFVGNLDFASKDEDLRVFFETLMIAEKGAPPPRAAKDEAEDDDDDDDDDDDEDEEDAKKASGKAKGKGKAVAVAPKWVKHVRIIRDKDTLLGKGFAYVQFTDRDCVDEILTLEETKLKFAKRKLRVQRCKTLPGGTQRVKATPSYNNASASSSAPRGTNAGRQDRPAMRRPSFAGPIPKGDPALGQKLQGLSKDERKRAKASDADRVARRLAKKQAKALAERGVKSRDDISLKVRKRPGDKKASGKGSSTKGRVRSSRALSKMNTKK